MAKRPTPSTSKADDRADSRLGKVARLQGDQPQAEHRRAPKRVAATRQRQAARPPHARRHADRKSAVTRRQVHRQQATAEQARQVKPSLA